MIAIVLLGLLVCASAVPCDYCKHHSLRPHHREHDFPDEEDDFDKDDLSQTNNKPSVLIDGEEFKISLKLQGFDKKDVRVKVHEGLLVIRAIHERDSRPDRVYSKKITLPDNVENKVKDWLFEKGLLEIVLPITPVQPSIDVRFGA